MLLTKEVPLAEGIFAFAVLVGLQWLIAWLSARSKWVRSAVKSEPVLLARNGEYLHRAMRSARISEEEAEAALRSNGLAAVEQTSAIILETNGTVSVIPAQQTRKTGGAACIENRIAESLIRRAITRRSSLAISKGKRPGRLP